MPDLFRSSQSRAGLAGPSVPSARRVLFVITEDWFFVSHFLVLAETMVERGYTVSVHVRINDPAHASRLEKAGIRVLPSVYDRGSSGRVGDIAQIGRYWRLFSSEKPDVIHIVSLRVVVLAGLAARLARVPVRVHALTGMGVLGAARGWKARSVVAGIGAVLRHLLNGRGAGFIFENPDDPSRMEFRTGDPRVLIVGGAGVDPHVEAPLALPDVATLRVAIVSRMIHSKGIAVAVEALRMARLRGADVELTLVGGIDPGNPRSLTERQLQDFAAEPGITWEGRSEDVRAVWRTHHVACVPSLGGEGLPRTLLEAAAAARPLVTTDTPGCSTFVRDMREGLVMPPGDASALADAFVALAADRDLVRRLGQGARARVLEGFTVQDVSEAMIGFYQTLATET